MLYSLCISLNVLKLSIAFLIIFNINHTTVMRQPCSRRRRFNFIRFSSKTVNFVIDYFNVWLIYSDDCKIFSGLIIQYLLKIMVCSSIGPCSIWGFTWYCLRQRLWIYFRYGNYIFITWQPIKIIIIIREHLQCMLIILSLYFALRKKAIYSNINKGLPSKTAILKLLFLIATLEAFQITANLKVIDLIFVK